jgi:protein TonB
MFGHRWIAPLVAAAGVVALSLPAAAGENYKPPTMAGPQVVKYPADAQRAGEEGVVVVQVFVTEGGEVRKARLVNSSGIDRLDNAAIESVLAWRFKPAQENGATVARWTDVRVVYKVPQ